MPSWAVRDVPGTDGVVEAPPLEPEPPVLRRAGRRAGRRTRCQGEIQQLLRQPFTGGL